ncbi:hypothetical protein VFC2026_09260 [Listeria monocytogenes]|nr:hypothetical protein [Listeria monocytogenes]EUJ18865.1 hypothetical protein G161_11181 [Listeria monocytogenes FSL F6-684]EAC2998534.1 hypothetical protein [Listeria monocytogenes]EAC4057339.1 hypothetical protein [Listeria monocytogenes]EAC8523626.1 hypothetical protein [Listeria monocytogenes]
MVAFLRTIKNVQTIRQNRKFSECKNRYNKYCKLEKHEDKTTFRQENMAVKNIQLKRQKNKITRRKTRYNK